MLMSPDPFSLGNGRRHETRGGGGGRGTILDGPLLVVCVCVCGGGGLVTLHRAGGS